MGTINRQSNYSKLLTREGYIMELGTTKVAATKRGFRIWIEGGKLTRSGFTRGEKYSRNITPNSVIYSLHPDGGLTVAGRVRKDKDLPIIDYSGLDPAPFALGDVLRVSYGPGFITITKE
jgi:hypothetical protein